MSNANQISDQEALEFYNLATGRLLTGLEVRPHHNTNFQFKIKFQVILEIRKCWLIFDKIFKLVNFYIFYLFQTERSRERPIIVELEDIDGIFQHDSVPRKRWNRTCLRSQVYF